MSEQDQGGQASMRREPASPRRAILRIAVILAVCLVIYVAEKKGWLPNTPQRSTVDQQSGQVAERSVDQNPRASDEERTPGNPSIGPADEADGADVTPRAPEKGAESAAKSSETAAEQVAPRATGKDSESAPAADSNRAVVASGMIIRKQTIRDEDGKVVYQGDVDVSGTLARIRRGESFPHRNDGSVFQNREGRLPRKPTGYYHEYVHPTPKLRGPGPQRIIIGEGQEVYYTPNHYGSFQRLSVRE